MKKQFSYSLSLLFLALVSGLSISMADQTNAAAQAKTPGNNIAGKYCVTGPDKDFSLLEARTDKDHNLDFGVSRWTAGKNCGVTGNAKAVAGGWRYEDGLSSQNKADHCIVTLKIAANGDIVVETDKSASCANACGVGVNMDSLAFPASSQQSKEVTDQELAPDTFFNTDCSTPVNTPK